MMDKVQEQDCVSTNQSCSVLSFWFVDFWRWDR